MAAVTGQATGSPADLFEAVARIDGHRCALIAQDGTAVTYRELLARAERMAAGLHGSPTVAVAARNSVDYVALILAVARAGVRYVPLMANFDHDDVHTALSLSGATMIVTDGHRRLPETGLPVVAPADLRGTHSPSGESGGIFRLLWSSGSTGFPKMIAWRQDALINERLRWNAAVGITATDVFGCRHPLDVAHATDLHLFSGLLAGATVALIDPETSPSAQLDRLAELRVTVLSALPSHYAELATAGPADLTSLRLPLCGGAYLSRSVIEDCARNLGVRLRQIYGSTEFGLAMVDIADRPHLDGRMALVDGVRARLEPVAGAPHIGELVLTSGCTSEGYLGSPSANRRTFRTPDFWTGDVAEELPDGTYRVLGRVTEALAGTDGPILAPHVDERLTAEAAVADAVTLPADPGACRDEVLVAVRPAPGYTAGTALQAARDVLQSLGLRGTLRAVDAIPRTPVGKADKPTIRDGFALTTAGGRAA